VIKKIDGIIIIIIIPRVKGYNWQVVNHTGFPDLGGHGPAENNVYS
jgi:hypothetical protein